MEDQMNKQHSNQGGGQQCTCGACTGLRLFMTPGDIHIEMAHLVEFTTGVRFKVSEEDFERISKTDFPTNFDNRRIEVTCLSCGLLSVLTSKGVIKIGRFQIKSSIGFSRIDPI